MFHLRSQFKPTGDQPKAIEKLTENIKSGVKDQVLLGVTGSGKTFAAAKTIENIKKPVLVISHNKTLCAQLYQEFKEFFPKNAVHYFVSYYDYYQPEAYIPQTDTYIEKDAKINEEIDRLRHAAIQDLLTRNDVLICASVSCIYNIGSPENYQKVSFELKKGQEMKRKDLMSLLTSLHYERNDYDFSPGTFRARGDIVEVFLVTGEEVLTIEISGNRIKKVSSNKKEVLRFKLFPAVFWTTPEDNLKIAVQNIREELRERLAVLKKQGKLLEAQRLKERTLYDLEMLEETGYCHGVENYSSHLEFRKPGEAPFSLIDYYRHVYGSDFLVFVDESHMTMPQIKAMSVQDRIRKKTLIEHGFRLPSAVENRPLTLKEFEKRAEKTVYVSATPGNYEKKKSEKIVEQLIRPTGLLEPETEIRPAKNQIQDLIKEIKGRAKNKQRSLVITLTKKLAESLSEYLSEEGIKTKWLHSEVKTLERPGIISDLREGKYDALVGINLLREGLDLPEVSLIAILDADKEGFLRDKTTLIQIMGRAARHPEGKVLLYADRMSDSMKEAIKEIERRREIQEQYNKEHDITPKPVTKEIRKWLFGAKEEKTESEFSHIKDKKLLEKEMKTAAKNLDFERAAEIRDLIEKIKKDEK